MQPREATAPPDGPPFRFGNYLLDERLGEGGMAEVWKARMAGVQGFQKVVCIKRVLRHLAGSDSHVAMFIAEAKLSARLSHPNIVQVFDLGEVDGEFYMAMELVRGVDLQHVLRVMAERGTPMPPAIAAYVAREICRAIAYAHEFVDDAGQAMPIVHRDVTPHNVMLGEGGMVKLVDFGVAKALVEGANHTRPGIIKGKLSYIAPEQLDGQRASPLTDIFSAGIVLFEMLTNQRLFHGNSDFNTLHLIKTAHIPPPSSRSPKVPPELDRITRLSLERITDRRYQRASLMASDLDPICAQLGGTAEALKRFLVELKTQARAKEVEAQRAPRAEPADLFDDDDFVEEEGDSREPPQLRRTGSFDGPAPRAGSPRDGDGDGGDDGYDEAGAEPEQATDGDLEPLRTELSPVLTALAPGPTDLAAVPTLMTPRIFGPNALGGAVAAPVERAVTAKHHHVPLPGVRAPTARPAHSPSRAPEFLPPIKSSADQPTLVPGEEGALVAALRSAAFGVAPSSPPSPSSPSGPPGRPGPSRFTAPTLVSEGGVPALRELYQDRTSARVPPPGPAAPATVLQPMVIPNRRRPALVAGLVVALVGVTALFAVAVVVKSGEGPAMRPAAAPPSPAPQAPTIEPLPAAAVSVRIETTPAGAYVFDGDRRIGKTPCDVPFTQGQTERPLVLEKSGYDPLSLVLTPEQAPLASYALMREGHTKPEAAAATDEPPAARKRSVTKELKDPFDH